MILVKCPPLCFNLHTEEESERQNVKAKNRVLRKETSSTILSSCATVHGLGEVFPEDAFLGVMHLTFAMLTCSDVHR